MTAVKVPDNANLRLVGTPFHASPENSMIEDNGKMQVNRQIKYKWRVVHTLCCMLFVPLGLFFLVSASHAGSQERSSGRCTDLDFSRFYKNGALQWPGVARVLFHEGRLWADETGKGWLGYLLFNQKAEVLAEKGAMIKVRIQPFHDKSEVVGWAHKGDLLCQNQPIKSESGLEMKFLIKTATTARNAEQTEPRIPVFQDPDLKSCVGGEGNCSTKVSRFHMYFVFDQTNDALLLADRFRLEASDQLLGWVSRKDGFLWNNAFGLRPRENLRAPDGQGPGAICTYARLEDAVSHNKQACQPVVGGINWFQSPVRIPVLDMVDAHGRHVEPGDTAAVPKAALFYKVALGRPGLVARRAGEGLVAISPGLARQIMPDFKSLNAKKQVDIFFLLDATASMEPVFDAVRGTSAHSGVIQEIIKTLKSTPGFEGTQFQFGFRVYRDPYADALFPGASHDGIGEGQPMPTNCNMNDQERGRAFAAFKEAISRVKVTRNEADDDYQENLYGALNQVLRSDIAPCPDHLKLLFVIGDSGYQTSYRGKAKYAAPVTKEMLVHAMSCPQCEGKQLGAKTNNVIPFFIQTPFRAEKVVNRVAYRRAYDQFSSQVHYLLKTSLPKGGALPEHFFRMGGDKLLVDRIVGTVKKLGSSTLIDEIILDIRGGGALNAIIDQLRRKRVDIPGLFWHILEEGACGELGKQCEQRIYDTTQIGYIEATDEVVEELWVTSGDLASWIHILEGFEGYGNLQELELRRALIQAMILGLQKKLGSVPPLDALGETLAQYAGRRGGLPVRRHSPLLSYNVHSLAAEFIMRNKDGGLIVVDRDKNPIRDTRGRLIPAVPECELQRLAMWAVGAKEILEVVQADFKQPTFKSAPYRPRACPDITPNGSSLARVEGAVLGVPLGPDDSYRFTHSFGGLRVYWIPQEYLP